MDFITWLQTRLIAHGAAIKADGDWGRGSIGALRAFQQAKNLPVTGVADRASIDALKLDPETGVVQSPIPTSAATAAMPPWMAEMHRRMGLHEIKDHAPLVDWLKIGRYLGNPKELPWCGDAVETCFAKTLPEEILPSNPFFAQNWKSFGVDARGPIVGAVGVIRWNGNAGHVGFVAGLDGKDRINLLGGNQQNAITIASFPRSAFIAWRWPSTFPLQYFPALKGVAQRADLGSTR